MNYAILRHRDTNHSYGYHPYDHHLRMVVKNVNHFDLVPAAKREIVIAAAWTHDVIEDCRETYNDVRKATNEEVADIVYALTNEKGKTRTERANDKYYEGIRNTPYATYVKLCDRLANVQHSMGGKSSMLNKYREEHPHFRSELYVEGDGYESMWGMLDSLLNARDF